MSVYFYGCTSIDGYLADKNHNLDWLYTSGTVEETGYNSFYQNIDITIMGKKTFDEISKMDNAHLAYPTTKNYVFTHSEVLPVSGFIPIAGDVVGFVKSASKDKNIWVVGGNQLLAPLLDNDMVDTMIIQIAPVLLGEGIQLFTQKDALNRFSLEETNRYGQFAELVYRKIV
ncbi:dihydrofolate reductase family protein [Lachnospiraceae bacterium OttesenSCG-928-D06]|nr:dihydrofolate reductase family protein [Lachnospiraceae bacterium OttesenSCG-928-D06]